MYQQHPSLALNSAFREQPYQGAVPEEAEFLFIGLDANYAPEVERSPAFASLLDYHRDGVAFWRRLGVHHPFLLPSYRGDGRRYHQNFARIGFGPQDAHRVSFAELLHVPTVGRNALVAADLDIHHLQWLDSLVTSGARRHVFVSAGVVRLMAASQRFDWLTPFARTPAVLPVLYSGREPACTCTCTSPITESSRRRGNERHRRSPQSRSRAGNSQEMRVHRVNRRPIGANTGR